MLTAGRPGGKNQLLSLDGFDDKFLSDTEQPWWGKNPKTYITVTARRDTRPPLPGAREPSLRSQGDSDPTARKASCRRLASGRSTHISTFFFFTSCSRRNNSALKSPCSNVPNLIWHTLCWIL